MATFARPGAPAGAPVGGPAVGADAMLSARQEIARRFGQITGLPEAKGPWSALATHLAVNTDLSAEEVRTVLTIAQEVSGEGERKMMRERLHSIPNPDINYGADVDNGGGEESLEDLLAYMRRLEGREPSARDSIADQNKCGISES